MNDGSDISIHDNILVSYAVHCERREIRLHTEYREDGVAYESTEVIFTGVVCYDFEHDSDLGTIIFDVEEWPAIRIYNDHAEQFRAGVRWGWPGDWASSETSAESYLKQNGIRGFVLSPSLGMSGWVLVRDMRKVRGATGRDG